MSRTRASTVFVLVLLLMLVGCSNKDADRIIVGVLQPNMTDSHQMEFKNEIISHGQQFTHLKFIFADAGNSIDKQKDDIQHMVSRKVDVIIVQACDEAAIASQLAAARDLGIHIVMVGYAPADANAYSTRLFVDYYKAGYLAGEAICEVLNGKGLMLEVMQDPVLKTSQELKRGFLASVDRHQHLIRKYVVVGYETKENAADAILNSGIAWRQKHVDAVYAHNDNMLFGALRILREAGSNPKSVCISPSGETDYLQAVWQEGADVIVHVRTCGREAVEASIDLMHAESLPKEQEFESQVYRRSSCE